MYLKLNKLKQNNQVLFVQKNSKVNPDNGLFLFTYLPSINISTMLIASMIVWSNMTLYYIQILKISLYICQQVCNLISR